MGFVAVDKIFDERMFSADERGVRTYRQVWRVQTDTATYEPGTISAATGLPRRYRSYYENSGYIDEMALAMEMEIRPQEEENPFVWLVTVTYSTRIWEDILRAIASGGTGNATRPGDSGGDNQNSNDPFNPLNRPWTKRWSNTRAARPLRYDIKGNGIRNSATDLLDPLPEFPERIGVLTITRAEVMFDDKKMFFGRILPDGFWGTPPLLNSVNSDYFLGYDPGFVLFDDCQCEYKFENSYYFADVSYSFLICPPHYNADGAFDDPDNVDLTGAEYAERNGWNYRDGRFLDAGFNALVGGQLTPILRKDGQRATVPALLDGAGAELATNADEKYVSYVLYRPTPFAAFGFR